MMQINVSVAAMLSKAMLQRGCCQPRPSIVFLSSVSGLVGDSGLAAYSASKSALIGLCRSLAIELAPSGTRVNCVVPGLVRSEMASRMEGSISSDRMADVVAKHPLGIGEPLDVAQAIAFLLADSSKWITGTALVVDGGYTAR